MISVGMPVYSNEKSPNPRLKQYKSTHLGVVRKQNQFVGQYLTRLVKLTKFCIKFIQNLSNILNLKINQKYPCLYYIGYNN